jgi:hypothetical protein
MITWDMAHDIAWEFVRRQEREEPHLGRLVVFEERTVETPYGWIFFWNSEASQKDPMESVLGADPFMVSRDDGEVYFFPAGGVRTVAELIEEYRKHRRPGRGSSASARSGPVH